MDEAEYCHRVALMYHGKIIALGAPRELKQQLGSYGLLHLDSSDLLESMHALEGEPGVRDVAVFGGGLHVTVEDSNTAIPGIRQALGRKGVEVRRLEAIPPSLEDVFVAMIEAQEHGGA
jgi:ABC-2 type transport system ATP-binding protein